MDKYFEMLNRHVGLYFKGINVNDPKDYQKIIDRIDWYDEEMKKGKYTEAQISLLNMERGDLVDAAKRLSCHISMCTEDMV